MTSLLSPRRTEPTIALKARVSQARDSSNDNEPPVRAAYAWLIVAVGGALATALAGWIIVSGLAVVGWLAASPGSLPGALMVGTQLWLLANGGGAVLGGTALTLVPLAVTLLYAFMINKFAAFAGRQFDVDDRSGRAMLKVVAAMTIGYVAPVVLTALLVGGSGQAVRAGIGGALIAAVGSASGSARGLEFDVTASWPTWLRVVPRSVLGAQLVLAVAGLGALVTAVVINFTSVQTLTAGLNAGQAGGVALFALQLAFLPNLVIWAASYALGAGFGVGVGSVVSPSHTDLGMLPSIPVLGALPSEGPGSLWLLCWLAAGVVAGGVAAWLVVRASPGARFDQTSLVGGLAGVLSGLVFTGLGWISSGDLGVGRLVDLGPRLPELAVLAVTTMGLAGLLVGLVFGLVNWLKGTATKAANGKGE